MYGYKKETKLNFNDAINKTKEELKKEGFGVLTEINVKDTLKEKLGVDFDKYVILGACNPSSAFKALDAEREIGLLLPCNVIVYEDNNKIFVSAIKPTIAMQVVDNEQLNKIADHIENKLKNVIDKV